MKAHSRKTETATPTHSATEARFALRPSSRAPVSKPELAGGNLSLGLTGVGLHPNYPARDLSPCAIARARGFVGNEPSPPLSDCLPRTLPEGLLKNRPKSPGVVAGPWWHAFPFWEPAGLAARRHWLRGNRGQPVRGSMLGCGPRLVSVFKVCRRGGNIHFLFILVHFYLSLAIQETRIMKGEQQVPFVPPLIPEQPVVMGASLRLMFHQSPGSSTSQPEWGGVGTTDSSGRKFSKHVVGELLRSSNKAERTSEILQG
jgi:hypothetical protein